MTQYASSDRYRCTASTSTRLAVVVDLVAVLRAPGASADQPRAAGAASAGNTCRTRRSSAMSRSANHTPSPSSGARTSTSPPRTDDHRVTVGAPVLLLRVAERPPLRRARPRSIGSRSHARAAAPPSARSRSRAGTARGRTAPRRRAPSSPRIQLREPQVVADRQADPADVLDRCVTSSVPGRERRRLAERRLARRGRRRTDGSSGTSRPARRRDRRGARCCRYRSPSRSWTLPPRIHIRRSRATSATAAPTRPPGKRLGHLAGVRTPSRGRRRPPGGAATSAPLVRGLIQEPPGQRDSSRDVAAGPHLTDRNSHWAGV